MGQRRVGKHEKNHSEIKRHQKLHLGVLKPKKENESGRVADPLHFERPVASHFASAVLGYLSASDMCAQVSGVTP